jgi:Flp pilus assembly pilin Flp
VAIEYALLGALLALIIVAALLSIGPSVLRMITSAADGLA